MGIQELRKLAIGVGEALCRWGRTGEGEAEDESKWEASDEPLTGLSVGDAVYEYQDGGLEIIAKQIVAIRSGVGLHVVHGGYRGPWLRQVVDWAYGRSPAEAAHKWYWEIKYDIDRHEEEALRIPELKKLLAVAAEQFGVPDKPDESDEN